ncbi:MAG: flavodoxin family protein [Candidatus Brockarchaeota archaeon]|nr:flavodoxin family protein [Candidatus Brockarchaeota archaeon]
MPLEEVDVMKVVCVQSSPNTDGLTCRSAEAVLEGAKSAGAFTELVHLNKLMIESCRAHDGGWGTCLSGGKCSMEDDFQGLREKINRSDVLVFATPVYFGDLSESAKRFLDRWRRCEFFGRDSSPLKGKLALGIAAAGGSGRGAVRALLKLEDYLAWLQFDIYDMVSVTQKNKSYKLDMLKAAGETIAKS